MWDIIQRFRNFYIFIVALYCSTLKFFKDRHRGRSRKCFKTKTTSEPGSGCYEGVKDTSNENALGFTEGILSDSRVHELLFVLMIYNRWRYLGTIANKWTKKLRRIEVFPFRSVFEIWDIVFLWCFMFQPAGLRNVWNKNDFKLFVCTNHTLNMTKDVKRKNTNETNGSIL